MTEQPHLLSVYLTEDGGFGFTIDCPNKETNHFSCVLLEECRDQGPEHIAPEEPEMPEPSYTIDKHTGDTIYSSESSMEAVAAWSEFYKKIDAYEAHHQEDGFHVTDRCWLEETVSGATLNDDWELKGFAHQLITGPIPVVWDNAGSLDDSFLLILPYVSVPEEPHADTEEIHDPTHVGRA